MTQQLEEHSPFPPIVELLSVDSTNNYALGILKQPQPTGRQGVLRHGSGIFAHDQFAGKGQRGKLWSSKAGENVHLSIVVQPQEIGLNRQFLLSVVAALAVRSVFDRYAQSDIAIKWPNDIYFQNRKAGGILIESIISGNEWKWAVVGIGLNINQTKFDNFPGMNPVSLKQITGQHYPPLQIASEIRTAFMLLLERLDATEIMKAYNHFLYKKGATVTFEKENSLFEATVKEVLHSGQLVVQTDMEMRFDFGEVKWAIH